MYREQAGAGVINGVLSGLYAGGPRKIDAAKLPVATRTRLADALSGRAEPTPILHERVGTLPRIRTTWAILLSLFALFGLTAVGFANPRSHWAVQPTLVALGYAAVFALVAISVLESVRRRGRAIGSSTLIPGRYLFSLDVIEVRKPERDGTQIVDVTPLGEARDARVRKRARQRELVLVFSRGAEIAFALRSATDGEHALRRLEHAQTLMEELTYKPDLARALANDPLFDIRADGSWDSVAPSGPPSARSRALALLLQSQLVTVLAIAFGCLLGAVWLEGRNAVSARSVRAQVEADRAAKARRAEADRLAGLAPPFSLDEVAEREARCLVSVHQHPSANPRAVRILDSLVRRAITKDDNVPPRDNEDRIVPIRFTKFDPRKQGSSTFDLESRERTLVNALERVFSETCPAEVIRLVRVPSSAVVPSSEPGIVVDTYLTYPGPTFSFDVTLRGVPYDDAVTFHLKMAPPTAPLTHVRDRSVFQDPDPESPHAADLLLSARAYDRLYDEMYGLFFGGDPRVPLHEGP